METTNYEVLISLQPIESFCLWCDLLGYGTPFINSNWDLTSKESRKNLIRIAKLQHLMRGINSVNPKETTLVLNDGFIKNVDVNDRHDGPLAYIYWLTSVINYFRYLNKVDKENGFPGARGVLTYGHRVGFSRDIETARGKILTHPDDQDYYNNMKVVYSPNEFQMNTAFSKAYIMESLGSRVGLRGPNLYIDAVFLDRFVKLIYDSKSPFFNRLENPVKDKDNDNVYTMEIKQVPVSFEVNEYEDNEFYVWEVIQSTDNSSSRVLFKLWFDKNYINISEKGINTKLYKLIKYKPDNEDSIINLE
ncbi:hypothetical protein P5G65_29810 [Paenibacillus chondroitinus]|uniref:Uncharacterized protein n=1 Tax=Paenibacillus chondroitinus TaxID=59842 RepID=A0ABU6DK17_9BACL|nr:MULTISPECIES: hypothetical protein [Paenibacillus]MCY9660711.1 hypothetical protein [Paenibacillus anseongense]MEB4798109.1 hypothetical protein [Paenibacillus chondroitinus]